MRSCRPLLGTYVEIRVDGDDESLASRAIAAGFSAIEHVHRSMSVFDQNSDIARINRQAHYSAVRVDPWTHEVLSLALDIHHSSNGLFDCGIAPQLAAWGMLPEAAGDAPTSTLSNVRLHDGGWVECSSPTRLDLGGIAKGFAVDCAAEAMLALGAPGGVINAGGDLRVFGEAEEAIYLRDPGNPEQLHFAGQLRDGACATSATYYSRRSEQGQEVSALVDPRTRQALQTRRSYSIVAPRCAAADALTKVLALAGETTLPCFARYDAFPLIIEPSRVQP